MAKAASLAEAKMKDVSATAVTAPLKMVGFRKSGNSYFRKRGDCVQVVNIQLSQGSTSLKKTFYVNVGVAFDAICRLTGLPFLEQPKAHECEPRGIDYRLEQLFPGAPASWEIDEATDAFTMASALGGYVQQVIARLDAIDGMKAFRIHPWFEQSRPRPINAQVFHLIGDNDAALREVEGLAARFADRQNANRVEWWLEHLHLTGLKPV